jgi:hypothetical protein
MVDRLVARKREILVLLIDITPGRELRPAALMKSAGTFCEIVGQCTAHERFALRMELLLQGMSG